MKFVYPLLGKSVIEFKRLINNAIVGNSLLLIVILPVLSSNKKIRFVAKYNDMIYFRVFWS